MHYIFYFSWRKIFMARKKNYRTGNFCFNFIFPAKTKNVPKRGILYFRRSAKKPNKCFRRLLVLRTSETRT